VRKSITGPAPLTRPAPLIWTQPPPPPRQRFLGRAEIVTAAIGLADEAGAGALTMKAVAARLGLVDLMLDAVTAEIPRPAQPGPDWRADLEELAAQTRQMIRRHPWYAALYHTRPPAGPHMMERLEFMLAVLTAPGASTAEAMTYAAMIDRYILGSALQETEEARMSAEHGLDDEATLRSAMNAVHDLAAATGRLPRLTSWLAHPAGPPPEEQFSLGLGFLLDGIARCLTMAENPARSDTIGP
jgi:hypothetical protein